MGRLLAMMYDRMMRNTEDACLGKWRKDLLDSAHGSVLEVGAGTGVNLALYPDTVQQLVVSEPDRHMREKLLAKTRHNGQPDVEVSDAQACALPHADSSFDCVVTTLVLCSVPDLSQAIEELRRVLVTGGQFLFLEHVAADDKPSRLRWQRRLEPFWKACSGNCHLTRQTEKAITSTGFTLREIRRESMRKAMPLVRPTIRGTAIKA